jgi:TatD DNase family protein
MEFIDTHCHLHFESFDANRDDILQASQEAGVNRIICVGTTLADSRQAIDYAQKTAGVYAAAGVHPHEAKEYLKDESADSQLTALLRPDKVVAVGEIGLDFYKNYAPQLEQEKALRAQIEASLPACLPYIFHVRDAWSDFWRIFDEYTSMQGVVHSFSSGVKQLDAALSRGLYIGLNGIMTFTKDHAQLDAAKQLPLERLVLETDAPFLAPVPFRGQTCEPKHTAITAEFLANLRNESIEELSKAATDNSVRIFNLK